MSTKLPLLTILPALTALACTVGGSGADDAMTYGTSLDGTGDESGEADDDGGTTGPLLDMNGEDEQGSADDGGGEEGCSGIDFLFVIDNSGSMFDEQEALIAAFPSFVESMTSAVADLDADDFHIMVVDTDTTDDIELEPGCAGTLGAGRTNRGTNNSACDIAGDQRYLVDGQPDLEDSFGCIALVGDGGSNAELPINAVDRSDHQSRDLPENHMSAAKN